MIQHFLTGCVQHEKPVEKITRIAITLTNATIDFIKMMKMELPAIPNRPHCRYTFRKISKLLQGLLLIKDITASAKLAQKLFYHESVRVSYSYVLF